MSKQKQKCPTIAGSGISKTINTDSATKAYSKLIFENEKAFSFCVLALRDFDERLNKRPKEFLDTLGSYQLAHYHALIRLDERGRE